VCCKIINITVCTGAMYNSEIYITKYYWYSDILFVIAVVVVFVDVVVVVVVVIVIVIVKLALNLRSIIQFALHNEEFS